MQAALTRLPRINPWYTVLLLINVALSIGTLTGLIHGGDWDVLVRATERAGKEELYEHAGTKTFVWSPIAAHALALIVPFGLNLWRAVQVAAALAMPTWTLRGAVLVSWPFWTDFTTGNLLTVIFLSAVWALRGSKIGTFAFFGFALLIPRPLLAPIGLWILWKRPEWRAPFAGMFIVHELLVLWTGLGSEWISTLIAIGPELQALPLNLSPTRFLGYWWLLIGIPLGMWLFWKGRLGWAGLAISNYAWFYYLYFSMPEVNRQPLKRDSSQSVRDAQGPQ